MKRKGTWIVVSVLVVLGLLLGGFGCAAPAPAPTPAPTPTPTPVKPIVLKVTGYGGPTYPLRILQEEANQLIEERSGGRLKIEFFPEQSLVKMRDVFEAAPTGVVDIFMTCPLYAPDLFGIIADVENMVFNWDMELFQEHYRDPGSFYDFQQPYWEKNGLYLLSWPLVGGYEVGSTTPIHTLEDWKGKLVRTVAGFSDLIKALGAEPVFIATGELYEAMQRGTVDACTVSMSSMRSLSIQEVAPYFTIAGLTQANIPFGMSLKARQELPSDLVKLIDEAFVDAERNHNARLNDLIKTDIEFMATYPGVQEVYYLPADEKARWSELASVIYADLAEKYGEEWERFWPIRNSLYK